MLPSPELHALFIYPLPPPLSLYLWLGCKLCGHMVHFMINMIYHYCCLVNVAWMMHEQYRGSWWKLCKISFLSETELLSDITNESFLLRFIASVWLGFSFQKHWELHVEQLIYFSIFSFFSYIYKCILKPLNIVIYLCRWKK